MFSETKRKYKNLAILERKSLLREQGALFEFGLEQDLGLISHALVTTYPAKVKISSQQAAPQKFQIKSRRFIGNKYKLLDFIENVINQNVTSYNSFCDLFAGTGVVGHRFNRQGTKVISNDILFSSYAIVKTFLGSEKLDLETLSRKINYLNNLYVVDDNYFSLSFANKFFTLENSRKIGAIREEIEEISHTLEEKYALLTSLMYATDKVANTVGHYDAYRKKIDNAQPLKLLVPDISIDKNKGNEIYREDANELAKKIEADIVYIDPPYNSRQYSRFYHVLETLVKWEKPRLYGVARKPEPENISEYCKVKAPEQFADLIKNLKCSYIVVSYNNTYNSKSHSSKNKITLDQIRSTLSARGETKVFKTPYRYFNSGKTSFTDHQELLFLTKVQK